MELIPKKDQRIYNALVIISGIIGEILSPVSFPLGLGFLAGTLALLFIAATPLLVISLIVD
jgi:hypothetical protein